MRVRVDADKCQGHARCHAICPELFAIDDESGKSRVRHDPVPPPLEDRAERAVDNCPESALSISN